jgi:hypothetical protein
MARRNLLGDDDFESSDNQETVAVDARMLLKGVSTGLLSQIFRMDNMTVRKRLKDCPEVGKWRGGAPLFDLAQAAGYLVKPKIDIKEFIKSVRPADLPPYLQSEFWEAQVKRQKFEENAGELWRTEKVIALYAETFKLIKDTMNLWVDSIERESGLTGEQRDKLTQLVDGLQSEMHSRLLTLQEKEEKTANSFEELADIEGEENYKEKR